MDGLRMEDADRFSRAAFSGPARDAVTSAIPAGISLDVLETPQSILGIAGEWRQLHAASHRHRNVFQAFDWLSCWMAAQVSCQTSCVPLVLTGRRNGTLVFVWPMMKSRSGPLAVLRWMSEPFGQYGDVLVADGECPRAWMADGLNRLRSLSGIDSIRLRHVRSDAAAAPFLRQSFRDAHFSEHAPALALTQFPDEAAYEARYSSQQRKRRKKIRKALEDALGPVTFALHTSGPKADAAIEAAIAEKSRWIEERGRQNRVLSSPELVPFLKALSQADTPSLRLVVSELSAGGKPISWEIGLRSGNVHYAFITSHLVAYTDLSPARLHMDLSQRRALADGMATFDLMLPHDAYKDSWSCHRTEVNDYHLPLTAAGQLYGRLYLERVRPFLRRTYYRLPPAALRLLKPIVRH